MALYEVANDNLAEILPTSFTSESLRERQDIQRWLRDKPEALGEPLFVLAEEFGDWEDARRRIDLLALDSEANLVVIELKRTEDGGLADLQAIRYAAMVSSMTLDDAIRAHERYMSKRGIQGLAGERILRFLGIEDPTTVVIGKAPRILLVAQDFSLEMTTTVLWLVERGLDIRCIQIVPYKLDQRLILDVQQVLPLDQATDYQVKIREKDETAQRAASSRRERTLHTLARHGIISKGTEIEVIAEALPRDGATRDGRIFQAIIDNVQVRESIIWKYDGQRYSPTTLTRLLNAKHGLVWLANNIFMHWKVASSQESMWSHAERLARPE